MVHRLSSPDKKCLHRSKKEKSLKVWLSPGWKNSFNEIKNILSSSGISIVSLTICWRYPLILKHWRTSKNFSRLSDSHFIDLLGVGNIWKNKGYSTRQFCECYFLCTIDHFPYPSVSCPLILVNSTSPDEMQSKYDQVVTATLRAVHFVLVNTKQEDGAKLCEQYQVLLQDPKFFKYAKSKNTQVKSQWNYGLCLMAFFLIFFRARFRRSPGVGCFKDIVVDQCPMIIILGICLLFIFLVILATLSRWSGGTHYKTMLPSLAIPMWKSH